MRLKATILFLFFIAAEASAQYYTRDAGIRAGEGVFLSYRQFFKEEMAIEGFAGISKNGFRILGLREYFRPVAVARSDNLKFMYGYGVHAGVDYTNHYTLFNKTYRHKWMWTPQFGFDGIVGLEYSASEFPLLISGAFQPYFEFSINRFFILRPLNLVIAVKYRF
jgi:hypothetical protein